MMIFYRPILQLFSITFHFFVRSSSRIQLCKIYPTLPSLAQLHPCLSLIPEHLPWRQAQKLGGYGGHSHHNRTAAVAIALA